LVQVDALASAHERLRADFAILNSDLDLAKTAVREAEKRALVAEEALRENTLLSETRNKIEVPEHPVTRENEIRRTASVHELQFSPHLPPNQAIQALDREVVQELLNDVDSCIALLES
jgi:DNA helicase TIP49 (TBP-interacting protein)